MLGRTMKGSSPYGFRWLQERIARLRLLHTATLERFARKPITRKSLNALVFPELCQKTALFASANYVKDELPTRLAHRIVEMKKLPYFVLTTPSLYNVYQIYINAFSSCSNFPPITSFEQEALFCGMLKKVVSESAEVVELVAKGLFHSRMTCRRLGLHEDGNLHFQLQDWVEILMSSRIGRRVLAEQHIALHETVRQRNSPNLSGAVTKLERKDGIVDIRCDVLECLNCAILASKRVSFHHYGISPEVVISGCDVVQLPFVRPHLEYILFELLKNAMRATVEHFGARRGSLALEKSADFPAVQVFVAEGPSELTIRISDAGGGLSQTEKEKVFEYGYTTVTDLVGERGEEAVSEQLFLGNVLSDSGPSAHESPMAGLGFGLPMSR